MPDVPYPYFRTATAALRATVAAARGDTQAAALEDTFLAGLDALLAEQHDPATVARQAAPFSGPTHRVAHRRLADGPEAALRVAEWRRTRAHAGARPGERPWGHDATFHLAALQRALHEGEVVVSYHVGGAELFRMAPAPSFAVVIQRHRVDVVELSPRDLSHAVSLAVGGMQSDQPEMTAQVLGALHRSLLAPVLQLAPNARHLALVPDGALAQLPFGALRDERGEPLIRHRSVSVAPSLTELLAWRQRAAVGVGALSWADPPTPLAPLPYARAEGQALVARLGGRAVVGDGARADALVGALRRPPGLLHLGTHAVIDRRDADAARVWLADGPLSPADLRRLPLRGAAVLLAACHGAAGEPVDGAGVLGLGRALLDAGATAVVASVAALRDDEAQVLVERIGEHLAAGHPVAGAVARAQSDVAARGWPDRAWAPLVVLGDGDRVVHGRVSVGRVLAGAVAGLLVGLSVFGGLGRRAPGRATR
jgi:hypothetical protein